jgi:hypothetical protein
MRSVKALLRFAFRHDRDGALTEMKPVWESCQGPRPHEAKEI